MIRQSVLLDFAKIAPKWAELYQTYKFNVLMNSQFCSKDLCKIKKTKGNSNKEGNLNIQNSTFCVLGEAYGFHGSFYDGCGVCDEFSYEFAVGGVDEARGIRIFEEAIKGFVKHFKEHHPRLWAKK